MVLVALEHQPALEAAVLLVVVGVHNLARVDQGLRFGLDLFVRAVVEDDLRRDDRVEHLVRRDRQLHRLVVDHVVREPLGDVVAGRRHKVAAAALAQVHLKELVLAVALVVLHVEVRKADVADALEEALHLLVELLVVAVDDRGVAADASGECSSSTALPSAISLTFLSLPQ